MIKRLIKSVLRAFGVLVLKRKTGIYIPEDEMPKIVRRLCEKESPVVIDGGAHRGDFVHAVRREIPGARFVCFEPDPGLAVALKAHFHSDSGVSVQALALGDLPGTTTFNINKSRATNSLLPSTQQADVSLSRLIETTAQIDVEVTTLDSALERLGFPIVDIVKFDLQGFDYRALKGAQRTLRNTCVVVVEVWFAPIYAGAATYLEVCNLMKEQGYSLYSLTSLHYSGKDRLLWCDAIFVPSASAALKAPITL